MFATLFYDPREDEPLRIQQTHNPAEIGWGNGLQHVACDRCRTKKLRCGGEKPGCGRCKAKSIACVYPSPTDGRTTRQSAGANSNTGQTDRASSGEGEAKKTPAPVEPAHSVANSRSNDSSSDERPMELRDHPECDGALWDLQNMANLADFEPDRRCPPSSLSDLMMDDALFWGDPSTEEHTASTSLVASPGIFDDLTSIELPSLRSSTSTRVSPPALPTPPESLARGTDRASASQEVVAAAAEGDFALPCPVRFLNVPTSMFHAGRDGAMTPASSPPPGQLTSSACLGSVMQCLEDLIVKNNQHQQPVKAGYSLDSILSSQKRALGSCDNMLSCKRCHSSDGMVLLILTCEALVISFERVLAATPALKRAESQPQALLNLLATTPRPDMTLDIAPTVDPGGGLGLGLGLSGGDGGGGVSSSSSSSKKRSRAFLGEYEVDSGQEWSQLLQMLVVLQLNGLNRLIKRLREAATATHSESRLSILSNLEQRLRCLVRRRPGLEF